MRLTDSSELDYNRQMDELRAELIAEGILPTPLVLDPPICYTGDWSDSGAGINRLGSFISLP